MLNEQVTFQSDVEFCKSAKLATSAWASGLAAAVNHADLSFKDVKIPKSEKNKTFFQRYESQLLKLKKTVLDAKGLLSIITKESAELDVLNKELEESFKSLKESFASVQRTLTAELAAKGLKSIKPEDYVEFTGKKSELVRKIAEIKEKISKESTQRESVLTLSTELNDLWLEEFRDVEKALSRINGSQSALNVSSKFKGDKEGFRERLEELCKGSGIRKDQLAAIVEKYPDFASLYRDLEEGAKLVKAKAEEFKKLVLDHLPNLLVFQVQNSFDITYHGKPLKSHSLGQRASAMMLFLLSQEDSDLLLVDQPEDDLDSQTIYEEVVKLVRNLKPKRQFIFVTHNPNFPVLGDTEVVAACSSVEEVVSVTSGSIDTKESQSRIVKIMEGGSEAFARRKLIYEAWHTG